MGLYQVSRVSQRVLPVIRMYINPHPKLFWWDTALHVVAGVPQPWPALGMRFKLL